MTASASTQWKKKIVARQQERDLDANDYGNNFNYEYLLTECLMLLRIQKMPKKN